jgi:2-C-methyl-D-erythritol 4-phosphate cytidylyltransferase
VPSPDPAPAERIFALLPCAGSGSRAGTAAPKQYHHLAGRALVRHTLAALQAVRRIHLCLVVTAPGDKTMTEPEAWHKAFDGGGATRALTVRHGIEHLRRLGMREGDWVLVHDAARCLVTAPMVDRLINACQNDAVGGLLAIPLTDTLKEADNMRVLRTLERPGKWLAQTPQMFRAALLEEALRCAGDQVTDESSAIEALGHAPLLVPGNVLNFKLTYPEDFAIAEALLRSRA